MQQGLLKLIGIVQGLLGAGGAALPDVGALLGAGTGGSIFNLVSGAVLSYLGFKGSPGAQRSGSIAVGGLNALTGLLGASGALQGLGFAPGPGSNWIQLVVGAVGLLASFLRGRTTHA